MKRVQVLVSEEQLALLRRRSAASGRPVAGLLRDAVDAWVQADEAQSRIDRALAAIGGFHSGLGDLSENHDRYLDETIPG